MILYVLIMSDLADRGGCLEVEAGVWLAQQR